MTGKKHSDRTKQIMSEVHKGVAKSDAHKKHLSESLTGRKLTEEHKLKCKLANQGSNQKTSKYTDDEILNLKIDLMNGLRPKEASEKYNIPYNYIYSGILSNKRWSHLSPVGWEDFLKDRKN